MELRDKIKAQIEEIKRSLYGIEEIIKIFVLSKAADLTVLMLGEHAIAKSSLARDWSTTTGLDFRIVTSSEVDEAMLAYIDPLIFRDEHRVQMKRGELMLRDHILIDEFFLWPNKFRAKLHELLEERTYAGLEVKTKTYTFACVDEKTEVLTREGWKSHSDLKNGDYIWTYNIQKGKLELEPLLSKYEYNYRGPLVAIEDRDLSMRLTPNHRSVVKDKRKNCEKIKLAQNLTKQIYAIPQARESTKDYYPNSGFSDDFIRLVAWLVTEGRIPEKHNTLQLYQSEGLYEEEIRKLLKRMKLDFYEGSRIRPNKKKEFIWTIHARDGKKIKEFLPSKNLEAKWLKLPRKQLEILFETLLKGDGWRKKKENRDFFCNTRKTTIDTFQALCVILGKRPKVKLQTNGVFHVYVTDHKDHIIKQRFLENYEGIVWCPNTKNSTWVARRNGTVFITGNSNPLTEYYSGQIEDRNLATEDRIDLLLPMYQPSVVPTQYMIKKFSKRGRREVELAKIVDWEDYLKARKEIMQVEIPPDLLVWLTLFAESMSACKYSNSKFDISRAKMHVLCAECNQNQHLCSKVALSKPRFLRATLLLSKALAWFDDRNEISEEDIFISIKYTLPHRLIFLKEEKTILEAERAIPEILQEFIDDFNNWESRKIFKKLEAIIVKAKDPDHPFFDREQANILMSEVAEHLAISNYVKEAIGRVQEAVERKYREILENNPPQTIEEMKEILTESGLDLYEKGKILDELLIQNPNLTFRYPIDRRDKKALGFLADILIKLHEDEGELKIKTKKSLLRTFKREISFTSDLITIREERGRIRITAANPQLKKKIEKLFKRKIK